MSSGTDKPSWSLPYATLTPQGNRPRGPVAVLRIACYALLAAAIIVPSIQFQEQTVNAERRGKESKGAIGRWRFAAREFWAG